MNKPVLIAASLTALVVGCTCCIGVAYLAHQDQEHYGPLAAACEGRGVAGAASYVPGGANKTVYFERSARTWIESNVEVPAEMRGEGVGDTALVACAADDTTRHVLEQCCFQQSIVGFGLPGSERCMPRVQFARHVEVRVASTGALLAERDVYGPLPKTCDDWVGRRPAASNFEASEPDVEQIAPFLSAPTASAPPAPVELPSAVDGGAEGGVGGVK